MRLTIFIGSCLLLLSCKNQNTEAKQVEANSAVIQDTLSKQDNGQTYAEISVKQGGFWEGKVYKGDNNFINLETLKVPEQHSDHSYYIRYEGPGIENNKIGYRLYLDWRNAIDIFGKKTEELVLSKVGQDGYDSYHELSEWGADILKVGKSLGIGSIGCLVDKKVEHFKTVDSTEAYIYNHKESSEIKINYYGWKPKDTSVDITSLLTIKPDTRYVKHSLSGSYPEGLCTGIVRFDSIPLIQYKSAGDWNYIATYGNQSILSDGLGMAILYRSDAVKNLVETEFDHILEFKPNQKNITFYFLGAWQQEENGITSKEEFVGYLDGLVKTLNHQNSL